jgi:hypothetical protein
MGTRHFTWLLHIAFRGRGMVMVQTVEKTSVARLGALLQEHAETVLLGQELIRLSVRARIANRMTEAVAAEQAAEDCIVKAVLLEEQLKRQL